MEPLLLPDQETVDDFLPPFTPTCFLDPENPRSFGAATAADSFYLLKKGLARTMEQAVELYQAGCRRFAARFGRRYDAVSGYRLEDAELVFCAAGALCGTTRVAVDRLRQAGQAVGLLQLRLFRPFPAAAVRRLAAGKKQLVVLNRAISYGAGGTLAQELRAALYRQPDAPVVNDVIVSLGGREVFPETLEAIARRAAGLSATDSIWLA
jgi:pyruvate/2-oxoacid:ferredoxin oxidoreductase alpha subunit